MARSDIDPVAKQFASLNILWGWATDEIANGAKSPKALTELITAFFEGTSNQLNGTKYELVWIERHPMDAVVGDYVRIHSVGKDGCVEGRLASPPPYALTGQKLGGWHVYIEIPNGEMGLSTNKMLEVATIRRA